MAAKRKKRWFQGGRGAGENKWTKRQRSLVQADAFAPGFLFTCHVMRSREALREAYNLLAEAEEALGVDAADANDDDGHDAAAASSDAAADNDDSGNSAASGVTSSNAGSALAAEIAALKQQPATGAAAADGSAKGTVRGGEDSSRNRFSKMQCHIKGCFAMRMRKGESIGPVDYIKSVCDAARASGQLNARFIQRAYPLQVVCRCRAKDLGTQLAPLCDDFFDKRSAAGAPMLWSFAIEYRGRHVAKTFRADAIKTLADTVAARHAAAVAKAAAADSSGSGGAKQKLKVDLGNPAFVVLCQGFDPFCGLSVLSGDVYRSCEKFIMSRFSAGDEAEDDAQEDSGASSSSSSRSSSSSSSSSLGGGSSCSSSR